MNMMAASMATARTGEPFQSTIVRIRLLMLGLCVVVFQLLGCSSSKNSATCVADAATGSAPRAFENEDRDGDVTTAVEPDIEPIVPASREPNEDWEVAMERALAGRERGMEPADAEPVSARKMSELYTPGFDTSRLPEWPGNEATLLMAFRKMRDERVYTDKARPNFLRRTTWLYPIDGCFVRAAHAAQSLERQNWPRPGKVFAFGRLRTKTEFSRKGYAYWSYHVATAYRLNGVAMVFDATVEPMRPLTFHEWVMRMARQPDQVRVTVCDTWTYSPSQRCRNASVRQERSSRAHQHYYLSREWNNVRNLGKTPETVLGEAPPWTPEMPSTGSHADDEATRAPGTNVDSGTESEVDSEDEKSTDEETRPVQPRSCALSILAAMA